MRTRLLADEASTYTAASTESQPNHTTHIADRTLYVIMRTQDPGQTTCNARAPICTHGYAGT
eukprot:5391118-Prymnesium_polylepis.1